MKQIDNEITKEDVLKEITGIAFSPIAGLHGKWVRAEEFEALPPEHMVAVKSISTKTVKENVGTRRKPVIVEVQYVKVKLYSKARALGYLNRIGK